jgi:hypothetical protein
MVLWRSVTPKAGCLQRAKLTRCHAFQRHPKRISRRHNFDIDKPPLGMRSVVNLWPDLGRMREADLMLRTLMFSYEKPE